MNKRKNSWRYLFVGSILLALLLTFVGRPLLKMFQLSYESIEDTMGGYVASMIGAVVGTFLAISSAAWLERHSEIEMERKTQKINSSILLGDIGSLIRRAKCEAIWSVAFQDKHFELWGKQASYALREETYYSFLTEEQRIEYVNELVKISDENDFTMEAANRLLYFYESVGKKVNQELLKNGIENAIGNLFDMINQNMRYIRLWENRRDEVYAVMDSKGEKEAIYEGSYGKSYCFESIKQEFKKNLGSAVKNANKNNENEALFTRITIWLEEWIDGRECNVFQRIENMKTEMNVEKSNDLISELEKRCAEEDRKFDAADRESYVVKTLVEDDKTAIANLTQKWNDFPTIFPVLNILGKIAELNQMRNSEFTYYDLREAWMYFAVLFYLQKERDDVLPNLNEDCPLQERLLAGVEAAQEYFYSDESIMEGIPADLYDEIIQVFGEESNWCPEFEEDSARYVELIKPYCLYKFMENNEKNKYLLTSNSLEGQLYLLLDVPMQEPKPIFEIAPDSELMKFYKMCKQLKGVTRLLTEQMASVFEECHRRGVRSTVLYQYHGLEENDMQYLYDEICNLVNCFGDSILSDKKKYMMVYLEQLLKFNDYYVAKMIAHRIVHFMVTYGMSTYLRARKRLDYVLIPMFADLLKMEMNAGESTVNKKDIVIETYKLSEIIEELNNMSSEKKRV